MNNNYHISVMPEETIGLLNVRQGKKYIDCTLGGGGHTLEILKRGGEVLGIDTDKEAIDYVRGKFQISNFKFQIAKGNFRNLNEIAESNGFSRVDGILYDLGVSTHQLKTKGRGFAFGIDEDLDMRMDRTSGFSAKDVINKFSREELYEIFTKYGEEKRAWTIADTIIRARSLNPIKTTKELADIILEVRGKIGRNDRTHPATRVFQALRIFVNDEIEGLKESLTEAVNLLNKQGRLVVISFHSLEDRVIKNFVRIEEQKGNFRNLTKNPIRPTEREIENNPSARSGKLRGAEKLI